MNSKIIMRVLTALLLGFFILTNIFSSFDLISDALQQENLCKRDFVQYFLGAKAIANNGDSGVSLKVLAQKYLPECENNIFNHPSPYPPGLAVLQIPLQYFTFRDANIIWLIISLLSLTLGGLILSQQIYKLHNNKFAFLALPLLILSSIPVRYDLAVGNLNSFIFLLISLTLISSKFYPKISGMIIGGLITFKPIFWPIALILILGKQTRHFSGICIGFMSCLLFEILISGIDSWISWINYLISGQQIDYLLSSRNYTALTLGFRLFHGMDLGGNGYPMLKPLIEISDSHSYFYSLLISGLCATLVLFLSLKKIKLISVPQMIIVGMLVSLLISPVTWLHHLLLLFLAAPFLSQTKRNFNKSEVILILILSTIFYFWEYILKITRYFIDSSFTGLFMGLYVVIPILSLILTVKKTNNQIGSH